MTLEIEFPEKLFFLLDTPARYKVLYGGRGAGSKDTDLTLESLFFNVVPAQPAGMVQALCRAGI